MPACSHYAGFPLAMLGLKDSLISLIDLPRRAIKPATIGLLACIAAVAILVQDIGLIVGVSGALLGASIVYVFPALLYGGALRQRNEETGSSLSLAEGSIFLLVPLGAFLGILGIYMTIAG